MYAEAITAPDNAREISALCSETVAFAAYALARSAHDTVLVQI
jgi:hypothetical protein